MSALEATFVGLDDPDAPFVFACILELDRPVDVDALRAHVDPLLRDLPRYRQRIERGRFGRASWVDEDDFRIERQIQWIDVGHGDARSLDELTAQLLQEPLPAEHSPWRLVTVDGLANGRGAVIAVVHHALVDGIAGFRLLEHIANGPHATPRVASRAPARTPLELARMSLAAVRSNLSWVSMKALFHQLRDGLRPSSNIGLNPGRTRRARVVATHTVPLDAVRSIEEAFGVTNNEVVLATASGALRRCLLRRGMDPARATDVRAMVPVGRHPKDARDHAGNRVVLLLAALPVDEPDPLERLRRVSTMSRHLKRTQSASGGDLLVALSDATTPWILTNVLRLALRMRAFNVIVTNVPGPARPLSLLGANLMRLIPIVNLWPHQGVGIAVASYAGALSFGVQADRAIMPDVAAFRDELAAAFEELRQLAAPDRGAQARPMQHTPA